MAGRTSSRVRPPAGRTRAPGTIPPLAYFAAAGVVLVVALIVVAAVIVFTGDERHYTTARTVRGVPDNGPVATAYSQAASTKVFSEIANRVKDKKPLTRAEVFDTKKITDADSNASLKLTASALNSSCTAAVWGPQLAGSLQRGRCTQVARGTYTDDHFAAMVTIFNLADSRAADQVVATADPKAGNGFPLVPPRSPSFAQGFSIARGVAMGHYAVITWVRHADGTGDERDAKLLSLLVATGKPDAVLARAAGSVNDSG